MGGGRLRWEGSRRHAIRQFPPAIRTPLREFKRAPNGRGRFSLPNMTHVPYNDDLLKNLNGKIAIITGISPLPIPS
jgi:hypothetical protein